MRPSSRAEVRLDLGAAVTTGRSSVALRVLVAHHLRRHRTRTRAITQRFREPCWFNMTVPRAHHFRHISVSPLVIAPTLPHAGCCVVLPMFPHTSVFAETTCVFAAGPFSGEFSTRIHCSTQVCPKQRFQATLLGGLRILKSPEVNDLPCGKCDPMRIDDNTSGFILLKRLPRQATVVCSLVLVVPVFLQRLSLWDPFSLFSSSRLCHVHTLHAHLHPLFHRNLFSPVRDVPSVLHRRQTIPNGSQRQDVVPIQWHSRVGWTRATFYRLLPHVLMVTQLPGKT